MDLNSLLHLIVAFRDARDWKPFHTPDQLAKAISIEAAELQEHFLWKSPDEVRLTATNEEKRVALGEEVADVLIFTLLLAHELSLDPMTIITRKLAKNALKYPIEKSQGNAKKYTEL